METQVNTTETTTTRSTGIRFGLIGAVISVAYFLVLNVAGQDTTQGLWSWLGYIITILIVVFAHKYFKEHTDGFMSYGQGIGIAFWIGLISGLITSLFTYLYIKFIDTGFLEMMRGRQIEALQAQGMSDQQIDKAMEFSSSFMSAEAIPLFMFIGSIIITVIIALIVTIFTQKTNPEPAF